jgi:hypothetical protein
MCDATETLIAWAPAAAAVASAIAAMAAVVNVWLTNRNARRARTIDLLLKKEAEFDGERMHKMRAAAAKALLTSVDDSREVVFVLDFMESVSGLVLDGDLQIEQAWRTFYFWFSHYYFACGAYIKEEQARDPAVWRGIAKLHMHLEKVQRKSGGTPLSNNLPAAIKSILENEFRLVPNESVAGPPAPSAVPPTPR